VGTPEEKFVGEHEFAIRSRERSHLENLIKSVKPNWSDDGGRNADKSRSGDLPLIWDDLGTDYEYRIYVTPEEWNTVWAPTLFGSIDYPNFKSKVHELVQEESVPREYERLLGEVYFDCLPQREKEYAFEVAKDRV
jgi:hypothetical protein